jgi:hypothetical protein
MVSATALPDYHRAGGEGEGMTPTEKATLIFFIFFTVAFFSGDADKTLTAPLIVISGAWFMFSGK